MTKADGKSKSEPIKTAQCVKNRLKANKLGMHSDLSTTGLYLSITPTQRSWLFIWTKDRRRRAMGLGPADGDRAVSLTDARQKAEEARGLLAKGIDPLEHKRTGKPRPGVPTFAELAAEVIKARAPGWNNKRGVEQWEQALSLVKDRKGRWKGHCQGIRDMRVDAITVDHVLAVLQPIWIKRHVTASRNRERIEIIMAAAKASGHRTGDNPAAWDMLKNRLPTVKHKKQHHAAMAYADVPAYVASLKDRRGIAAHALRYCIATATRENEAAGAQWSEIDIEARCWTIPAARMKADRDQRIPLSAAAVAVLRDMEALRPETGDGPVFPGERDGKPIVPNMLLKLLKVTHPDVTVHGFRSAFRTWSQECTSFPREVAEMALAHEVGDDTERAYARSDLFERRRELMDAWCRYLTGQTVTLSKAAMRTRRLTRRRPALALVA